MLALVWVRKMPKAEAEEIAMHFLDQVKYLNKPRNTEPIVRWSAAASSDCASALHATTIDAV